MANLGVRTLLSALRLARPAPGRWDRARRGWFVLGVLAFLSIVVVAASPWPKTDFDAYYRAAERIGRGENPYRLDDLGYQHTYRYPPSFAYLLSPLARVGYSWAGLLWFAGIWLTLAACLALSVYLVYGSRLRPAGVGSAALVALLACGCYACHNLFQGQLGAGLALACLGWAACQQKGWNFRGGLLLAAGCAIKVAPVVLLPYLVLRGDWRGLAGAAVGGVLLVSAPALSFGVNGTVELHRDWLRHTNETQVPSQNYRHGNQGLMGQLARLPHVSNGFFLTSPDDLANLTRIYPLLVMGCGALLYAWLAWDLFALRRAADADRHRAARVPPHAPVRLHDARQPVARGGATSSS